MCSYIIRNNSLTTEAIGTEVKTFADNNVFETVSYYKILFRLCNVVGLYYLLVTFAYALFCPPKRIYLFKKGVENNRRFPLSLRRGYRRFIVSDLSTLIYLDYARRYKSVFNQI